MYRFYSSPAEANSRVSVVGEHADGVLKIAVARCSSKDAFTRKKGRMIAEGRLAKGRYFKVIPIEKCDIIQFVEIAKETTIEVNRTKKVVE